MSQCPHCEATEHQTTYGRTMRGSQRYQCRHCARVYTPDPLPLGYPEGTQREAVRLYLEGTNFRRIGRLLGVNHQSVVNWVTSKSETYAVEAVNADLRHYLARLGRRSRCLSRCLHALRRAVDLFVACYNARQLRKRKSPQYPTSLATFI